MAVISSETWEEILQDVRERLSLSDVTFRTWLQPLKIHEVRRKTIVVLVTTGVMGVEYISKKYLDAMKAATEQITGTEYEICFILSRGREENRK